MSNAQQTNTLFQDYLTTSHHVALVAHWMPSTQKGMDAHNLRQCTQHPNLASAFKAGEAVPTTMAGENTIPVPDHTEFSPDHLTLQAYFLEGSPIYPMAVNPFHRALLAFYPLGTGNVVTEKGKQRDIYNG